MALHLIMVTPAVFRRGQGPSPFKRHVRWEVIPMAYPAVSSLVYARRVFGQPASSSSASYLRRAEKVHETPDSAYRRGPGRRPALVAGLFLHPVTTPGATTSL